MTKLPQITLVSPQEEHRQAALDYLEEHRSHGEAKPGGAGGLHRAASYEEWLDKLWIERTGDEQLGLVPSSTFFAVAQGGGIVGMVNIRHRLNAQLLTVAGHIGYGVRPSERRKGYATGMLAAALDFCRRELGLERAMVACNRRNEGSRRVILKNGGVYDNDFIETDGNPVERYWIDLRRRQGMEG